MARWLRRSALAGIAAVLTGCTSGAEPGEAARVLGDPATIQPCGLTALDVFAEFGSAEFGPPESFDYCTVVITPGTSSLTRKAGDEITIMIGELGRVGAVPHLPTDKLEEVTDSIYTSKPDDVEVSCWQTLVFEGDGLALSVRSRMSPAVMPVPTCDMVAAGMAKVVEVVKAGKVDHREPASNSLIALDPCELVTDEIVTARPGFADARRVEHANRHRCEWRPPVGVDGPRIGVTFGVREPPAPSDADSDATPVAGRPSVTTSLEPGCEVETGHIPFEEVPGTTVVETAVVEVVAPHGSADTAEEPLCDTALAIAEDLWPRLPGT